MKNLLEKTLSILPYLILLILVGYILIFFYKNNLTYTEYIKTLEILIWPTVILITLLFFRKVFTYLFFSMEEFNFFGNKGRLKNIEEVIENKVEHRIKEKEQQEKWISQINTTEQELKKANELKDDTKKKADEYKEIAMDIFSKYKELSTTNMELTKELSEFREEKKDRIRRLNTIRERLNNRSKIKNDEYSNESQDIPKANKLKNIQ